MEIKHKFYYSNCAKHNIHACTYTERWREWSTQTFGSIERHQTTTETDKVAKIYSQLIVSVGCIKQESLWRPPLALCNSFLTPISPLSSSGHFLWQHPCGFVCSSCLNNATWLYWHCCSCYCLVASALRAFTCCCHSNWCWAVLAPPMLQLLGHTTKSAFPKWPRATHATQRTHIQGNTHKCMLRRIRARLAACIFEVCPPTVQCP